MAKVFRNLTDVLRSKKVFDLMVLADLTGVNLSDTIEMNDWNELMKRAQGDRGEWFVDYYGELGEEDQEELWADQIIEDFEAYAAEHADDPELVQAKRTDNEFRKYEKHMVEVIGAVQGKKDLLAARIAEVLLTPGYMAAFLMESSDGVISILEKILQKNPELSSRKRKYTFNLPVSENRAADRIMRNGYGLVCDSPYWNYKDEHRHITGMTVTSDVLACFREVNTPDFAYRRLTEKYIADCCFLSSRYHTVAPVEIVYEIYKRICAYRKIEPVDLDQFMQIVSDNEDDFFKLAEYQGKKYIIDPDEEMEMYVVEENPGDENGKPVRKFINEFELSAVEIQENNPEFYIPDAEESIEFIEYGYWPSRDAYSRLRTWVEDFYLDEKNMSGILPWMMQMADPDSAEEYHSRYSMDNVDENTEEKMKELAAHLMIGFSVDNIFDDWKEISGGIREESLAELREIVSECYEQTNKPEWRGFLPMGRKSSIKYAIIPDEMVEAFRQNPE